MALVLADRVKETSTTTGTGTYTLAGAVTGFESFGSIGNGNTTYYACTFGSDFEVGIGTYTASGTTLARTTILQSSNSDNAVNWGSGTKTLFCTQPAEKAVFRDASGDVSVTGDLTLTSTDAGATENPTLDLYRNSASPADNDILGHLHFSGENDNDEKIVYAEIETRLLDASDGTEDGRLVINSILNGSTTTHYSTGFGFNQFHQDVLLAQNIELKFEGSTNDAVRTTLTVADPSSNRTVTLPDATGTVQLTDGSGANLTSLNASQLSSGTVPNARLASSVLTTSNSDAPSTTTSSSDADFVLIDDGGTMKKITPANLGVPANKDFGLVTGSVTGTEDFGSVA